MGREDSGKNPLGASLPKDTTKTPVAVAKDNKPPPTKTGDKTPAAQHAK